MEAPRRSIRVDNEEGWHSGARFARAAQLDG